MARIPYPDEDALNPHARKVLDALPVRLNLFSMLGHAPSLIGPTLALGGAILGRMELPSILRELAILRVAALLGADYEAHHHVPMARQAGLGDLAIEAANTAGVRTNDDLSAPERLVLALVDETTDSGAGSAQTVAALVDEIGLTHTVELIITIGYYTLISQVLLSLDVEIDAPIES